MKRWSLFVFCIVPCAFIAGCATSSSKLDASHLWRLREAAKTDPDAAFMVGAMYLKGEDVPQDVSYGAEMMQLAADKSHMPALYLMGSLYRDGTGVDKSPAKAAECFRKVADYAGIVKEYRSLCGAGAFAYGKALFLGNGVAPDRTRAMAYLEKGVGMGNGGCMYMLGALYCEGNDKGVRDVARGVELLQKGADLGNLDAMFYLGVLYGRGERVPQDMPKAVALLRSAADKGHGEAAFALFQLYFYGAGVEKNNQEAQKYLVTAFDSGNRKAAQLLAIFYQNKMPLPVDEAKACSGFKKAAEQDDPLCQFVLGDMYSRGVGGLAANPAEAAKWFTRAAEHQLPDAELRIAMMYIAGAGVAQDPVAAMKWMTLAAAHGVREAQMFLGLAYYRGTGVERNATEAYKWMSLAGDVDLGDPQMNGQCGQAIEELRKSLSAEDIAKAKEWVSQWSPKECFRADFQDGSSVRVLVQPTINTEQK